MTPMTMDRWKESINFQGGDEDWQPNLPSVPTLGEFLDRYPSDTTTLPEEYGGVTITWTSPEDFCWKMLEIINEIHGGQD